MRKNLCTLVGMQDGAPLVVNSMAGPQKIRTRAVARFSHSTSWYVPRGIESRDLGTCTPVLAALFTLAKKWKPPSDHQGMSVEHSVVHPHSGTWLSLKKEGDSDTCYNMDEPWGLMLSEISQTQKDKCCMILFLSGYLVKLIETESRMVAVRAWGRGTWIKDILETGCTR